MSKHQFTDIRVAIEPDNPAVQRLEFKCIKCGSCKAVCTDYIGVCGTYDLKATGDVPICINCGQCANVCPADSITEKVEAYEVAAEMRDPEKIVIFSTSPSVRIALGEEFGMADGSFVEGKMVALLKKLGADYVLDTNFAADLTIMEEASELVERITKGEKPLPQFTSCCPAWVKFAETYYPEMLPHISSAKSPIGMQGPTIKTYFARKIGIDPQKIVNVAVTPCTAKKYEIRRDEMNAAARHLGIEGMRDMDYVITTRELAMLAKDANIDFAALEDQAYDDFMGLGSGAGVIFGNTGGVMEAAVRSAYTFVTKKTAPAALYDLQPVRGLEGIKEASVDIDGLEVKVAIVYGTANVRKLIEKIKSGEKSYHFVEVMTCPGGCIGGGGQPKDREYKGDALRAKRIEGLYKRDDSMQLRLSHENPEIIKLYEEFYGEPLSELAEQMLHTMYFDRSADLGGVYIAPTEVKPAAGSKQFRCKVCGYIYEGVSLPEDYTCPTCGVGAEMFEEVQ
ncbi:[FeFe] hydrogenase, group A [uncultured Phascolarctobacterium sp.]|uniref:[FeFe] hydrogenase, group A n=1 Tax=uncultured Phascolarctobacterium sp. TaxID=512296 RepID=UPI0027D9C2A6|nr:[FeFe] hydrogenase, group A [uncultured Phascolarctobacterium sp.]